MRRLLATFIGSLMVGVSPASAIAQDILTVPLDHSVKITLPRGSKRVMVGAAGVVDITVVDMTNAVLLGRTFGDTNILVLDDAGRVLMDQEVIVSDAGAGRMTLLSGPAGAEGNGGAVVQNFACSPRCARYPMPGEAAPETGPYMAEYEGYPARAGGSHPAAAAPAPPAGPLGAITAMGGVAQAMGSVAGAAKAVGP